jgi:hypothetical protein
MRVPDQAPALVRNQRGQLVRRVGGETEAYGVSPSQYDEEGGGEEAVDDGGESGEEGGDDAGDSSAESEA